MRRLGRHHRVAWNHRRHRGLEQGVSSRILPPRRVDPAHLRGMSNRLGAFPEPNTLNPEVHERVTFGQAIAIAGAFPAFCIILTGLGWRRSFWDVHNGLLGSSASQSVIKLLLNLCIRPLPFPRHHYRVDRGHKGQRRPPSPGFARQVSIHITSVAIQRT